MLNRKIIIGVALIAISITLAIYGIRLLILAIW